MGLKSCMGNIQIKIFMSFDHKKLQKGLENINKEQALCIKIILYLQYSDYQ